MKTSPEESILRAPEQVPFITSTHGASTMFQPHLNGHTPGQSGLPLITNNSETLRYSDPRMGTQPLQLHTPQVSGCSGFSSLLLANCTSQDLAKTQNIDLSRCTPLMKRTINIAVTNKLNQN